VYRPFQCHKRSYHFIGAHYKTLSVAMRVHNPNRSPFAIDSCDPAQTPSGFLELSAMISQYFMWILSFCSPQSNSE
jgi:hypothetical protein